MDDSFIERWNKNIAADFDKALEVIRDKKLARAKPKTGYVPLELYHIQVAAERDAVRDMQKMYNDLEEAFEAKEEQYNDLKEELAAKDKEIEGLKNKLSVYAPVFGLPEKRVYGRFVSGREDIADRGFEKIVPDTKWTDQDDYYLLHSLRESNRRFRNRKS